jgi:hypothetical protein
MNMRAQRGSALLLATIVVLIITVMAVGMVRFAASETAGATGGARRQALVQCAEAARLLLVSKFHALGTKPADIAALNVPLQGPGGSTLALGGHLDTLNVTIGQVTYLPLTSVGPAPVGDTSNTLALAGQGGRPMKVVVHCQDNADGTATGGRQLEIEFGVHFGL